MPFDPMTPKLFRFSAKSEPQLQAGLLAAIGQAASGELPTDEVEFGSADEYRVAIVANDSAELHKKLKLAATQWQNHSAEGVLKAKNIFVARGVLPADEEDGSKPSHAQSSRSNIVFIFPGQGSQYAGMLKGLIESSAAARKSMQQADIILAEIGSPSFAEIAWPCIRKTEGKVQCGDRRRSVADTGQCFAGGHLHVRSAERAGTSAGLRLRTQLW